MNKSEVRKSIITQRDNMTAIEKFKNDNTIKYSLMNTNVYKESKKIFVYIGFASEINTLSFILDFLKEGKDIYIPKVYFKTKEMKAIQIKSIEGLLKSSYGILEPVNNDEIENREDIDLIIMPGVAFDKGGGRLGYGGGYYDKYLATLNKEIPKVALAYDFQVIDKVPTEEHDISIDCIITEKEVIFI